VEGKRLIATIDPDVVASAENVIIVIGTPVDEHLNPDPNAVSEAVARMGDSLRDGQLLVLRSTVYPGTTALVEAKVAELGKSVDVTFCPERIAEGKAMTELFELPQIVSSRDPAALDRAEKLFGNLTSQMVRMEPEDAELAKLFTNTWRYIRFATANQLFMMANDFGLDYERIRSGLTFEYPRASDLPGAGFAAGPCLLKDTMQLAAFNNNNFVLGHAAMMVNEGLPLYVVSRLEKEYPLSTMTVGLLGMSFKAESDDIRSSLSYKLKRLLRFKSKEVLCNDPYVTVDSQLSPLEEVLERSDLLILSTPHSVYQGLQVDVPFIDIWGTRGNGTVL
jgi:UDP-N-acetyl-D-mannosaminuronic acid dehydrogenase